MHLQARRVRNVFVRDFFFAPYPAWPCLAPECFFKNVFSILHFCQCWPNAVIVWMISGDKFCYWIPDGITLHTPAKNRYTSAEDLITGKTFRGTWKNSRSLSSHSRVWRFMSMVREALVTSVTWVLSRVLCYVANVSGDLAKKCQWFTTDSCVLCVIDSNSVPVSAGEVIDEPGVDGAELEIRTGGNLADVVEKPTQLSCYIV